MLYGVDVHARYQAGLNVAKLHEQGYTFLTAKASEGTHIPSSDSLTATQFKARTFGWLDKARDLGMIPGLYHWIKRGNGAAQARFFHDIVIDAGGPHGMLIQLDCEDDATLADIMAWAAEWRQLSDGHPFLLYTGGWWWRPRGWDGAAITPHLWDSHYLSGTIADPAAARIPNAWWTPGYGKWSAATLLQFTSSGTAGGITSNVDLNAFRGSLDQLRALTTNGDDMLTAQDIDKLLGADAYYRDSRNISLATVLTTVFERLGGLTGADRLTELEDKLDALVKPQAEVDVAALAEALAPHLSSAAEAAVRKVLGEVDGATPAGATDTGK